MNKKLFLQIKGFEKGDYVKVSWFDASDARGQLSEHKNPECLVDEWGVFLGMEGNPKHLLLGKHYVRGDHVWEATRIPFMLINNVELIAKRASSPVQLRKYRTVERQSDVFRVRDSEVV